MSKQYRIDELVHYGIKGQKWGRRRYQNADGSLTAAGKQRYGSEDAFNKQYEKDINREAGMLKIYKHEASEASKDIDSIRNSMRDDRTKKMKEDLDDEIRDKVYKMSDAELREAVSRMNMEERYTQVMKDRTRIDIGKTKTEKFLDFSSAALSATATALTIAIMLKELQK